MKTVKFAAVFESGQLVYPGGIEQYRAVDLVEIDGADWAVGQFAGDVLPDGVEEYPNAIVALEEESTQIIIDKVRYLDLLGDAAVAFRAAILNPETPIQVRAELEVAQEYLNAATTLDLKSDRVQGFLSSLQQLGILSAADVVRIRANQTVEEVAATA